MYVNFTYKDGSNPYISTNNKNLFRMIVKYSLWEISENCFEVQEKRESTAKTYKNIQNALREFVIVWDDCFCDCRYSWQHLADWGAFFEEYGKKYGLLREFRENGII